MQSLARMKFTAPTPIQAQAIPLAMEGKDILGTAQTGTGKTAAFGIPLVVRLMEHPEMKAIILTPTRELASQVLATLQQIIPVPDLRAVLLIGGEPMPRQLRQLQQNPRLIIGTPGRINDHLERRSLRLDRVGVLVLDETDRMLDMGFGHQIERIIKHVPQTRQTLMFSATLPQEIVRMAGKYLNNPQRIAVGSAHKPHANIREELIHTAEGEKYSHLLVQLEKRSGAILVFVKTKWGTERLAQKLCRIHHDAEAIHGDLQQRKRERVIQGFRDKKYRILVATDVAARGLDIPHIQHIINYDLPQSPEDYIHRIGRTARAGAEGSALSLITPAESNKWRAIQRLMNPGAPQERGPSNGPRPNNGRPNYAKKRRFGGSHGRDRDQHNRDGQRRDQQRGNEQQKSRSF
ncbi:MAG: DEAD/DEAH box helicase [Proteobacteria bacterium]|nr:DEAD/DEAH box helicase [Pseudomonadota bacterium]